MEVNNPNVANTWVTDDGRAVGMRIYPIPEWNMNVDNFMSVSIDIADVRSKIIGCMVKIKPDVGEYCHISPHVAVPPAFGEFGIHIDYVSNVDILLSVIAGSAYNTNANYSALGFDRGEICIMYIR